MKRPVSYAQLHAGFFLPGVGEFKPTLPSDNKTLPNFKMYLTEQDSLVLEWTGRKVLVGSANVKVVYFSEEQPSESNKDAPGSSDPSPKKSLFGR